MRRPLRLRTIVWIALLAALAGFLGWRMLRPLNVFTISASFARPVDTRNAPAMLGALHAQDCGQCHSAIYREWRTSQHSRAWTDPYFQADWHFDGAKQICRNCHTPLDRQQEQTVLGFRDADKWRPILAPNPAFDPVLQHEGVTCAACHLREGKIRAPATYRPSASSPPHPIETIADPNEICIRCHVVQNKRWDTFFRFPPCGTAAEIASNRGAVAHSGEYVVRGVQELGCVQCHMPAVVRPVVDGGAIRFGRRHLWRGGHDPAMVASALQASLTERPAPEPGARAFRLTLTNVGAAHYLPTGTPDRYLSVTWRLLGRDGRVLREQRDTMERTVLWRPFIVDLWDTRLPYRQPRNWEFRVAAHPAQAPAALDVTVEYHLLHESRRERIGYANPEPIAYPVFHQRIDLQNH